MSEQSLFDQCPLNPLFVLLNIREERIAVFGIADKISFADLDTVFVLQPQIVVIVVALEKYTRVEKDSAIQDFDDFIDLGNLFEIDIGVDHIAMLGPQLFEQ